MLVRVLVSVVAAVIRLFSTVYCDAATLIARPTPGAVNSVQYDAPT